jgi:hypothetical protein
MSGHSSVCACEEDLQSACAPTAANQWLATAWYHVSEAWIYAQPMARAQGAAGPCCWRCRGQLHMMLERGFNHARTYIHSDRHP